MLNTNCVIRDVKLTLDECTSNLVGICEELGLTVTLNKDKKPIHLVISNGTDKEGMIRIFDRASDNTRTIDGSAKNRDVNVAVLKVFDFKFCKTVPFPKKAPSKCATYDIDKSDFDVIRKIVENNASKNGYSVETKKTLSHINYMLSVKDEYSGDKAMVTQFESGKLTIQGKSWNVWDEICNSVDETVKAPVEDLIVRLVIDKEIASNEEKEITDEMLKESNIITNIITSDIKSKAKNVISSRLGKAYDFLYDHDRVLVTSSQCMLLAKVDYGDYYCYVAPVLRVIDGYLKKLLIDLNFVTEAEINTLNHNNIPTFNYGNVFHGLTGLQTNMKAKLTDNITTVNEKEQVLLKLYRIYRDTRSPLQHDGPPVVKMIPTYDEAEAEIDEILSAIVHSYGKLF